ncbi:MAG TPA: tRNA 2-thiouridine(34) synthase MnmA [Actinomycetota bacterium]|nr:tRNA 2-thiouridine(34) synthase MnmA [Actinomycetota bacterium]
MKRQAVVAMSGGVDSSVAAALMKEDGYEVTGIMLKLWSGEAVNNESGCCSVDAAEDARRVAQVLDIPFYVLNFADEFDRRVVSPWIHAYRSGRTPNPCVECNRNVKFAALLDRARSYDADVMATGHYARVDRSGGHPKLKRGKDSGKDQSYVLYMLGRSELADAAFPVGEYSKTEIRSIAESLGLRTAQKPESQEICFVPSGDSHAFLRETVPDGSIPGPVVDDDGTVLGTHHGFAHYTPGQRRGLGVALGKPLYVKEIRPRLNTVVVAHAGDLQVNMLELEGTTFVSGESPDELRASVMTRYRGPEAAATLVRGNSGYSVMFDEPQGPVAPGQAAVFYSDDEVLGGGTISSTH